MSRLLFHSYLGSVDLSGPFDRFTPLSRAQQEYVDAFMDWVRAPTAVEFLRRRVAFGDLIDEPR